MKHDEFSQAADAATHAPSFDPSATIKGVYRRRRRRRVALVAQAGSVVAVIALVAGTMLTVAAPGTRSTPEKSPATRDRVTGAELDPYLVSSTPAEPLMTIGGVELTYLPPNTNTDAVPERTSVQSETKRGQASVFASLGMNCEGATGPCGGSVGVSVTRAQGLTLEEYFENHWFGNSTDTTVGGKPAKANSVEADDAAGIVWAPVTGIVVEMHVSTEQAPELRKIVEGVRLAPSA